MRNLVLVLVTVFILTACSSPVTWRYTTGDSPGQYYTLTTTQRVEAAFPLKAQRNARQGCVNIGFHVGRNGRTSLLQVIAEIPADVFDKAAVRAVAQWRFKATDSRGRPVTPPPYGVFHRVMIFRWDLMDGKTLSILRWLCHQTVSRVLVASPAPEKSGSLEILPATYKSVDLVRMPVKPGTPLPDGWIDVSFCVDVKSRVTDVAVRDSSPRGLYVEAAIAALKTWHFRARNQMNGRPAKTCGLNFHIRVLGATSLARSPGVVNQRETIIPLEQLDLSALSAPRHGRVTLQYCIDRNGSVSDARVVAAKPNHVFDEAALKTLHVWQYWPKTVDGTPVRACGLRTSVEVTVGKDNLAWIRVATTEKT